MNTGAALRSPRETMTSMERLGAIRRGDRPDRVPVASFSGGYCAEILGYPIRSIYDDPQRSFWAQLWAQELLGYDGWPTFWYASYGAWEFGGDVKMPSSELELAPSITNYAARTPEGVYELEIPEVEKAGYFPRSLEFAEMEKEFGLPITVPAWGPFTAAANMVGVDKLCRWMIREPEVAHALLSKVVDFAKNVIDYFANRFRNCELWGIGGCATSSNQIISPRQFEEFVLPHHREVYARLAPAGVETVFCHVCGDQIANLPYWEQIPFANRGILSFGSEVDLAVAIDVFGDRHAVAGNVGTRTIGQGTWRDVYQSAVACINRAKHAPGGYVLMAGCDIPPYSPPFSMFALKKAVLDHGFYD